MAIYAPVGCTNGVIDGDFMSALWATYTNEMIGYVREIPIKYIIYSIISLISTLFCYFKMPRIHFTTKHKIALFVLFFLFTLSAKPFHIGPISHTVESIVYLDRSIENLKKFKSKIIQPQWKITSIHPKYKNYVVIIGESMRKDYMNAYGYPVKNTPFLSRVNGIFVDGYTSTGFNTIPNLQNSLNYMQNVDLNIVDLANLAGFETFWLSNQGFIGLSDSPITLIANRAKIKYFLQSDYSDSVIKSSIIPAHYWDSVKSDINLVNKFRQFLQPSQKNRLFFIHLLGSHPPFCEKLLDKSFKDYKDKNTFNINCYVQTIAQTDSDLAQIYKILNENFNKDNSQTFSMIYFSDHGLTHILDNTTLTHKNPPSKQALEIPLIKLSSDDEKRIFIKNQSYNNYFPQSFANWLGIKAENFSSYDDIFSHKFFENTLKFTYGKDNDFAIDISKFK